MKKFYKLVSTHQETDGWAIHLDGRSVKTPMKRTLLAPTEDLANAIQQEWMAQDENIEPETMPLMQFLSTQIDRVSEQRPAMSEAVLKYLDTDLICYFAPEDPQSPAHKQEELWRPWLDWFEKQFGETLETTNALAALSQAPAAHKKVKAHVEALDDARFTILQMVVPASGSLVLALAFIEGAITPIEILEAARVEEHIKDEIYDAERYGRDPMQEKKDQALITDLQAAEQFLKLI